MNDYSDIIMLMGAIVIFSTMSLHVNRTMLQNNLLSDRAEVDYHAVTVAQEIMEEIRWITSAADLIDFADDYPMVVNFTTDTESGNFLPYNVDINLTNGPYDDENVTSYFVTLEISSEYMTSGEDGSPITLTITKSFN
jgi:hypothetical protein